MPSYILSPTFFLLSIYQVSVIYILCHILLVMNVMSAIKKIEHNVYMSAIKKIEHNVMSAIKKHNMGEML